MLAAATDQVYWGRTRISYEYRFAEHKTLAITVHPDLRVTVVAPLDADLEAIRNKVRKRGSWIRRQWREFQLYLPQQPPRRYVNGESHRYLGRLWLRRWVHRFRRHHIRRRYGVPGLTAAICHRFIGDLIL